VKVCIGQIVFLNFKCSQSRNKAPPSTYWLMLVCKNRFKWWDSSPLKDDQTGQFAVGWLTASSVWLHLYKLLGNLICEKTFHSLKSHNTFSETVDRSTTGWQQKRPRHKETKSPSNPACSFPDQHVYKQVLELLNANEKNGSTFSVCTQVSPTYQQ